ncbi:MAG: hypothetical protein ACSLE0_22275 [Chitinophagaceae bacterium]
MKKLLLLLTMVLALNLSSAQVYIEGGADLHQTSGVTPYVIGAGYESQNGIDLNATYKSRFDSNTSSLALGISKVWDNDIAGVSLGLIFGYNDIEYLFQNSHIMGNNWFYSPEVSFRATEIAT